MELLDSHHPVRAQEESAGQYPYGFRSAPGRSRRRSLWEPGGNGSALRPVWIAYAVTDRESSPFTANFRAGRKAGTTGEILEIPKRGPHRWSFQKVPGGVTVAYFPSLFNQIGRAHV